MPPRLHTTAVAACVAAALGAAASIAPAAAGPPAPARAAGTLRGRVTAPPGPADTVERASAVDPGTAGRIPVDRRSVVYLDPAPRPAFDTREEPSARLDQRNKMFVPHVLAIVAGTTVEFPNSDRTYHNVFSLSKAKSFDLGRYAAGRSKSVRFDRPGIVRVFCDIHSHMSAFVLVFAHRYFAVTDEDGRYRIDAIPPGSYTVMTWNESAPLDTQRIQVPEAGGDVELNVSLRRR